MPCRRPGAERFLLLERAAVSLQSGAGAAGSGSKEVDALVAKLGEVLQLNSQHRTTTTPAAPPPPRLLPRHHSRDRVAPYSSPRSLGFFASLHRHPPSHSRQSPSLLLWPPPPPPPPPTADQKGSPRVSKQLCGRGWLRSSARAGRKQPRRPRYRSLLPDDEDGDDPHHLLQQLILSGNLIKEAVRRLQLAASTAAAAEVSSTTGSPGSVSSAGSCCRRGRCGSGSDGDAGPAFAVASLQALP
ncbi:LOW QUALITY PROTEIN: GSK-3-binding protein-like [Erythrolamprus reginae]|uniref:LOW QUALITY PROTEIN: GSK-3-binding protein-like n=1 Tax=Erythrolamprus reginae TaxID=121349 RepID=UPI00396C8DAC